MLPRLSWEAFGRFYPEGGWGWVVCGCVFVVRILTQGLLLSFGVLYAHMVREFGEQEAAKVGEWFCVTLLHDCMFACFKQSGSM